MSRAQEEGTCSGQQSTDAFPPAAVGKGLRIVLGLLYFLINFSLDIHVFSRLLFGATSHHKQISYEVLCHPILAQPKARMTVIKKESYK